MNSKLIAVKTKPRKQWGVEYPPKDTDFQVEIVPNASISIFKKGTLLNTFDMGSTAEYDSYNLSYMGKIVGISEKSVTIMAYPDHPTMSKKHRLDLYSFCWRNANFDAVEAAKNNSEMMMTL